MSQKSHLGVSRTYFSLELWAYIPSGARSDWLMGGGGPSVQGDFVRVANPRNRPGSSET
jgi:hypothetical protein